MDTFTQAQIDPLRGAELAEILGLNGLDLQAPDVYARYSEIMAYFSRFQDAPAVARMVARNAPVKEKLAKVAEYVRLRKDLDVLKDEMKKLPSTDTITSEAPEITVRRDELMARMDGVLNELIRYER